MKLTKTGCGYRVMGERGAEPDRKLSAHGCWAGGQRGRRGWLILAQIFQGIHWNLSLEVLSNRHIGKAAVVRGARAAPQPFRFLDIYTCTRQVGKTDNMHVNHSNAVDRFLFVFFCCFSGFVWNNKHILGISAAPHSTTLSRSHGKIQFGRRKKNERACETTGRPSKSRYFPRMREIFDFPEKQKLLGVTVSQDWVKFNRHGPQIQRGLNMPHYLQFFLIYLETRAFSLISVAHRDDTVKGENKNIYLKFEWTVFRFINGVSLVVVF